MNLLINKVVLFIGPVFYDYHLHIIKGLEQKGAKVIFYPERKYNKLFSLLLHLSLKKLEKYQQNHYKKILKNIETFDCIDYLFVVRGYKIPCDFIRSLRVKYPEIKTIMYQWDSQYNNPYIHLRCEFDVLASFDYNDAEKYQIYYRPLFYTPDLESINKNNRIIYDYFYISGYTYERYLKLQLLLSSLSNKTIKYVLYIPFTTYIKEWFKGHYLNPFYLLFRPLKRTKYIELLSQSQIMLDITHSKQSGLPIRIIEAMAAGLNILTTNENVLREFPESDRISIISSSYSLSESLIPEGKSEINLFYYSLDCFLDELFSLSFQNK